MSQIWTKMAKKRIDFYMRPI